MQVGVDLGKAGIGEQRAALVGAPDGGGIAAFGVGGEEEDVAVAAGAEHHRVAEVALDGAGGQDEGAIKCEGMNVRKRIFREQYY